MLPANSWTWSCGCSLTARPVGPAVRSALCYHQLCTRDAARHVTAACLQCQSSAACRPPPEAVVVSSKSLEQMNGHKTSPRIKPPGELSLLWISQLVWVLSCFIICLALICVRCLYFPASLFSPLSNGETSPDWDRWACHTQLFGRMMYHQDSGLQSGHVLFCYNNISTALTYLIYSCDLLQGR